VKGLRLAQLVRAVYTYVFASDSSSDLHAIGCMGIRFSVRNEKRASTRRHPILHPILCPILCQKLGAIKNVFPKI
jgi:hypothetical protein